MPLRKFGTGFDKRTGKPDIPWTSKQQQIMLTMNHVGEEGSNEEVIAAACAAVKRALGPASNVFKLFGSCERASRRHVHINVQAPNRITWAMLRKKLCASKRWAAHFNVWEASAGKEMGERWAYANKYLVDPSKKKELGAMLEDDAATIRENVRRGRQEFLDVHRWCAIRAYQRLGLSASASQREYEKEMSGEKGSFVDRGGWKRGL